MNRAMSYVLSVAFAACTLVVLSAVAPNTTADRPSGAAIAQMLPSESIMIDLGSKEERMKKSRTEGPGMKALNKDDPQWCISCHRNHDRVRARTGR